MIELKRVMNKEFIVNEITPQKLKKLINQVKINFNSNLCNLNSKNDKSVLFLSSIIFSMVQIFNKEDLLDSIVNWIGDDVDVSFLSEDTKKFVSELNKFIENFFKNKNSFNKDLVKYYINVIRYKNFHML